ncbi:hypothetical protein [Arthrobacter sp.]|uniref:hypothetical protein n=1 Tax=Arthrobacter sp. TaxID=1667 RepID=UPI0026DFB3D2|nr:hypothetical protein [Arthrobacter sp.]MDO5752087.1 hypothetical protein [Arthrobacter sp.]
MVDLTALVAAPSTGFLGGIQDAAPALTLLIAAIAIIPAWITIVKSARSSKQGRWWSEVQWALDAVFSENTVKQKAGIRTILILSREKWLGQHELEVLDAAWEQSLVQSATGGLRGEAPSLGQEREPFPEGIRGPDADANGEPDAPEADSAASREAKGKVQIEAAKLKVALDARLARETPTWVQTKSKE